MRTLFILAAGAILGIVGGVFAMRTEPVRGFLETRVFPEKPALALSAIASGEDRFSDAQLAEIELRTCFRRNPKYPPDLPNGPTWLDARDTSGQGREIDTPPRDSPDLDTLPGLAKLSRISRDNPRGSARFHCGATRISENWFLTAAHCIKSEADAFDMLVYPARADSLEAGVPVQPASHVICHAASQFFVNSNRFGDDIALVYVPDTDGLEDISITRIETGGDALLPGEIDAVYFAGWSQNSETVIDDARGRVILNGARFLQGGPLRPSIIGRQVIKTEAVKGLGPCQGDSGGPLYAETEDGPLVIGVLSSIVPPKPQYDDAGLRTNDNCRPQTSSFYIRTSGYTDWIDRVQRTCVQDGRFVC